MQISLLENVLKFCVWVFLTRSHGEEGTDGYEIEVKGANIPAECGTNSTIPLGIFNVLIDVLVHEISVYNDQDPEFWENGTTL